MDVGVVVANRFTIAQELGKGGFGALYLAHDSEHRIYVLKAESTSRELCSLINEGMVYLALGPSFGDAPVLGIPKIFYHGIHQQDGEEHCVLVMEYLERSLYERMIENGGTLSLKSVLMIGIQMLRILEDVHGRGFIHRDIKPDNILTGLSATDCSSLYLCDFGIAKRIPRDLEAGLEAASIYGTAEFCSTRALEGKEQGRCDDLESLFYTLIFLKYGSLPWQAVSSSPGGEQSAAARDLYYDSAWKDLPPQMKTYFEYIKCLDVREKPDYEYLRSVLNAALRAAGLQNDGEFEWSPAAQFSTLPSEEEKADGDRVRADVIGGNAAVTTPPVEVHEKADNEDEALLIALLSLPGM